MILRLRSGLVSGVVEKRERHLCVMVVPLRDVGRLVLHSPCGRACAGSLRNGTVKKGSGRACALPGVSQRPGKRLSAQRHHTTNSSIQAARDPSHARDFADGARLSQSCSRLPRTVQRQNIRVAPKALADRRIGSRSFQLCSSTSGRQCRAQCTICDVIKRTSALLHVFMGEGDGTDAAPDSAAAPCLILHPREQMRHCAKIWHGD